MHFLRQKKSESNNIETEEPLLMTFINLITEAKCFLMGWIEYKYVMLNF